MKPAAGGSTPGRGRAGGTPSEYLRSMRATRRRRAASCSWMSSMLRFFFAHYTAPRARAHCYIHMVIQSAVVPVAGHGTRLLPATKSQPKEMLPVARKPIVQYVVEELVSNGIQQILFVTGRSKASIENHFDHDPELFQALSAAGQAGPAERTGFRSPQGQLLLHPPAPAERAWATPYCARRTSPAKSRSWWRWAIPSSG